MLLHIQKNNVTVLIIFFSLDVSSGNHLLCLSLNLLRLYQTLSPELFVQVDFNLAKLLPTSGVGDKARLSDSEVLKNTLQIVLDSPSGCLKWKQLVRNATYCWK